MKSFEVYSLAIGANLTFSTASMVMSHYARRFSPIWVNQFKVFVAILAFITAYFVTSEMPAMSLHSSLLLFCSGFIGLCVGDIFLLRAFANLGTSRTLVMFSCEPLLLGLYGYFFLDQVFTMNQTVAVMCMVACVFIFMLERNKETGSWDVKNFFWAFLGILLDAMGIMLTRTSYEISPGMETFQVNIIRCCGAMSGFLLLNPKGYFMVYKDLLLLRKREITLLIGAALSGTFIALSLYLTAVKYAHVGTLTAISITGPVWVSLIECVYQRKLPTVYVLSAFAFFLMGFYLMLV
jgi:drug/metabolite transporter (DMT)-like permease